MDLALALLTILAIIVGLISFILGGWALIVDDDRFFVKCAGVLSVCLVLMIPGCIKIETDLEANFMKRCKADGQTAFMCETLWKGTR
jgi:hypothetical protein